MRLSRLTLSFCLTATTIAAQDVSTVIVPVVGTVLGPTNSVWKTDVEIANEGATPTDVAIELATAPDGPFILLTLAPGQVQHFTDIAGQAFGIGSVLSPMRVTTSGRRPVRVRAAAYAARGDETSAMEPIDVYPAETWFPVRVLDGLAFSDDERTNIGLVNFGTEPADFDLAVQRLPGRSIAVTRIRLAPQSLVHQSIQSLFPLITQGNGFSVVVETEARDTHIYASVIDSVTNTARFVVPRVGAR